MTGPQLDLGLWCGSLAAVALLPIGLWPARVLLGIAVAALLQFVVPDRPPVEGWGIVGEALAGAAFGFLAGLPVYAARAFGAAGPPALGFAGQVWAWAVFFSMGGPILLAAGIAHTRDLPGEAAIGSLFYGVFVLGLPVWLTGLVAAPLAGLLDRLGHAGDGAAALQSARPLLFVLVLAVMLPVLLDVLRGLWLTALVGS